MTKSTSRANRVWTIFFFFYLIDQSNLRWWWWRNKITREPICVVVWLMIKHTYIEISSIFLSVVKWWWGRAKDPIKIVLKKKRKECRMNIQYGTDFCSLLDYEYSWPATVKNKKKNDDRLVYTAGIRKKRQVVNSFLFRCFFFLRQIRNQLNWSFGITKYVNVSKRKSIKIEHHIIMHTSCHLFNMSFFR